MSIENVKALSFDVFGTVVDWRGSIIGELTAFGKARGIEADWARFTDAWRGGYKPAMARVRKGDLPWMNIDQLHRLILDSLLAEYRMSELSDADKDHLNRVWHRLLPWPDSVQGLTRLKRKFIITTLSNGNVALLTHMAKHAGLPWDCIFSAELFHHYKPDPETYRGVTQLLGIRQEQLMMVAAHKDDLHAAREAGCKTAFVRRPLEFGPDHEPDLAPDPAFEIVADDFIDLARQLGV